MTPIKYILIIIIIIQVACIPETRNLVPAGDRAEIKTKSDMLYRGEFLMVDEDAVVMRMDSGQTGISDDIYSFPIDKIQYIKIDNYTNYKWQGAILGFEVVPILLLFLTATVSGVGEPNHIAILLLPLLVNYGIFAASTPAPPGVEDPFPAEQLLELKKYSRFPQGLTEEQLQSLLSIQKQDKIKIGY